MSSVIISKSSPRPAKVRREFRITAAAAETTVFVFPVTISPDGNSSATQGNPLSFAVFFATSITGKSFSVAPTSPASDLFLSSVS